MASSDASWLPKTIELNIPPSKNTITTPNNQTLHTINRSKRQKTQHYRRIHNRRINIQKTHATTNPINNSTPSRKSTQSTNPKQARRKKHNRRIHKICQSTKFINYLLKNPQNHAYPKHSMYSQRRQFQDIANSTPSTYPQHRQANHIAKSTNIHKTKHPTNNETTITKPTT